MQDILKNVKKKGSFEHTKINEIITDMQYILKTKDLSNFKSYAEYYIQFQEEINNHYNSSFENAYFDDFDNVVTPILLDLLKNLSYEFQLKLEPYSTFSNEQFMAACKKYTNITQEEMNIKMQFILKSNNPFEQSIQMIRQIPKLQTFCQIKDNLQDAFTNIYTEVANESAEMITGDDLIEIMLYIILKAQPQQLLVSLYAFANNTPKQNMQGEIGYNLTVLMSTINIICDPAQDFVKYEEQKQDSMLLDKKYIIPQFQLVEFLSFIEHKQDENNLKDQTQNQNASQIQQQNVFIKHQEMELKGYVTFYCLDYIFDNNSVVKTLTIKCNCRDQDQCNHVITVTQVSLNQKLNLYQACNFDRLLTGTKNQLCYNEYLEDKGYMLILKSLEHINTYQQTSLILVEAINTKYNVYQLIQIYLLYSFGCVNKYSSTELLHIYQKYDNSILQQKKREINQLVNHLIENKDSMVETNASSIITTRLSISNLDQQNSEKMHQISSQVSDNLVLFDTSQKSSLQIQKSDDDKQTLTSSQLVKGQTSSQLTDSGDFNNLSKSIRVRRQQSSLSLLNSSMNLSDDKDLKCVLLKFKQMDYKFMDSSLFVNSQTTQSQIQCDVNDNKQENTFTMIDFNIKNFEQIYQFYFNLQIHDSVFFDTDQQSTNTVQHTQSNDFNNKVFHFKIVCLVRLVYHLLTIESEILPSKHELINVVQFLSVVDQNFFKKAKFNNKIKELLKYLPSRQIWKFIIQKFIDKHKQYQLLCKNDTELKLYLNMLCLQQHESLPYYEEFGHSYDLITPYSLSVGTKLLHFFIILLHVVQDKFKASPSIQPNSPKQEKKQCLFQRQEEYTLDILEQEGFYELQQMIGKFQLDKCLTMTQVFDIPTIQCLMKQVERMYYIESCGNETITKKSKDVVKIE